MKRKTIEKQQKVNNKGELHFHKPIENLGKCGEGRSRTIQKGI